MVLITFLATAAVDFMPGSPAVAILGNEATPEQVAALTAQMGLDQPLHARYIEWLSGAARGDLGESIRLQLPVSEVIAQRLPVTIELTILALLIALVLSVPTALVAGANVGGWVDRAASTASSALISLPSFAAAVILIYLLAIRMKIFPVSGWTPFTQDPLGNLQHAFLPALVLGLMEAAMFYRVLRSDVIATVRETFVLAARARGMGKRYVLLRHVLRPSLFSLLTLTGLALGRLLGGAMVVEVLFALPGLGSLLLQSVPSRDIPVIQGVVLVIAVVYVLVNIAVDLIYSAVDPRVRVRSAA
ncbi:ABC transporter permease [Leucobacter allii]|uniref:ABC transporter permease n=1 Tax=Leucobacter allii TaxID=2932247 RepID=A0ABY4FMF0_9MICO|nr:ABC transporter permease [Leucobacter allii]UOQ57452.1 ABC transporter permease [Leucobacter allii]UOR01897.1 ABC transporter permease [Leucobacter allii]